MVSLCRMWMRMARGGRGGRAGESWGWWEEGRAFSSSAVCAGIFVWWDCCEGGLEEGWIVWQSWEVIRS